MRISDWSSDVCSSDLPALDAGATRLLLDNMDAPTLARAVAQVAGRVPTEASGGVRLDTIRAIAETGVTYISVGRLTQSAPARSDEHTSELQSLMRHSSAVFCLNKKKQTK